MSLVVAPVAGATTNVGGINCQAVIAALGNLTVSVQNPNETRVQGPTWSPHGPAAATLTTKGFIQVLPSVVGGQTVQYYTNIVQRSQIIGLDAPPTGSAGAEDTTITTVSNQQLNGFYFDNNIDDATPPVPMDGIGADPPKPTLTISSNALAGPGQYSIEIDLAQSSFHLNVSGADGGAIYSPDLPLALTNVGNTQGSVVLEGDSAQLTAHLALGFDAVTTCSDTATPEFTIHVHNAGDPASANEPVVSCQPTAAAAGTLTIAKGLFAGATGTGGTPFAAGGWKGAVVYDGCVVPDTQADEWVAAKAGAPAAIAVTTTKAAIAIKAKDFGDCTLVSIRDQHGESETGSATQAYRANGSIAVKYENSGGVPVKVPGTKANVVLKLIIDKSEDNSTNASVPGVTVEGTGIVTKGLGAGGAVRFVGELDPANANVLNLEACNGIGTSTAAAGSYIGSGGLPIKTGGDATFEVSRP